MNTARHDGFLASKARICRFSQLSAVVPRHRRPTQNDAVTSAAIGVFFQVGFNGFLKVADKNARCCVNQRRSPTAKLFSSVTVKDVTLRDIVFLVTSRTNFF